jgi:hypothetical protein
MNELQDPNINAMNLNKLKRLREKIVSLQKEVDDLISESEKNDSHKKQSIALVNVDDLVAELKTKSREEVKIKLDSLRQTELGEIFAKLGGPSRDKKKKKNFLIDRILWQLFDFQSGHNILRN